MTLCELSLRIQVTGIVERHQHTFETVSFPPVLFHLWSSSHARHGTCSYLNWTWKFHIFLRPLLMKIHHCEVLIRNIYQLQSAWSENPPTAVWIDSSWWIFREGISQLVDFSKKHFAAGGFLLGGIVWTDKIGFDLVLLTKVVVCRHSDFSQANLS